MIRRGSNEVNRTEYVSVSAYNRFKIGDLVTPFFISQADYFGEVVEINPVEDKVYVDFQGIVRQMDPNEIRVVLKQKVMENYGPEVEGCTCRRAKKLTAGMKKAIYYYLPGKIYKLTKKEKGLGGLVKCPKCKQLMQKTQKKTENICFICIGCGNKVTPGGLV